MRKCLLILISAAVLLSAFILYVSSHHSKSGVQAIVAKEYQNKYGAIKSYGRSKNINYLSESIGQYMVYLLEAGDKDQFKSEVNVLKDRFLVRIGNQTFIKWQLAAGTTTNASVDDMRIIGALEKGSRTFHSSAYSDLAKRLETSLYQNQLKNGMVTDFYDWNKNEMSHTVHLSYIDYTVLSKSKAVNKGTYKKIINNATTATPFFHEIYDLRALDYRDADPQIVNMIDQLLIAIQYHKITGRVPSKFNTWIEKELSSEGKLYGRYNKGTLEPEADYESSSVYALALLYFNEIGDHQHSRKVHQLLLKQPPFNNSPDYSRIHFFDFINAKTADVIYKKTN